MRIPLVATALLATACGSSTPPPATGPAPAGQTGVFVEDLDRRVDPCTDFYEYANGTWRSQHPIPPSLNRWSRRWEGGERNRARLRELLDEIAARRDWRPGSSEQLAGDFYAACMDEARLDAEGLAPVRPLLEQLRGIRDRAGVQRAIETLHELAIEAPFGLHGWSDPHDPTRVIAWVTAAGLGLGDRDYYVLDEARYVETRTRYLDHVAAMLRLAGRDAAAARTAADRVLALETALARASLDNVALRDPSNTDHPSTLEELARLAPSFDWAGYFARAGAPRPPINVTEPAFLRELERQLAATSIDDWKLYLEWQLINSVGELLSKPLVDQEFAFFSAYLSGTTEQRPRWLRCVQWTDALLGDALGQKYVEKYFPPAAKARVQAMVGHLLAAMGDTIRELPWMGSATRQQALAKLATMRTKIGYPDKWKDYGALAIHRDAFFANVAAARRWGVADERSTIGRPVDRDRWGITAPTSDAYYSASLNEIVFPAGILQSPAFDLGASDAVNYGAIGVVIGHEISHGFDDQGARYDARGRLSNWWTPEDLAEFQARGRCVSSQYEGYFVEPGLHHNGALVLGESIGDLGGANLAYRAFQRARRDAPALTIDGFTPDQQFFISWGQFRGDAIRLETQRRMVQGDSHPIGKYRVIGPLANMPAFARAFGCKADAPMVRADADRCVVW